MPCALPVAPAMMAYRKSDGHMKPLSALVSRGKHVTTPKEKMMVFAVYFYFKKSLKYPGQNVGNNVKSEGVTWNVWKSKIKPIPKDWEVYNHLIQKSKKI